MRRRWLLVGGACVVGLALLVAGGALLVFGPLGEWAVRDKVVPRLEARTGRDIEIGSIDVSRGRVILRDLVVRGPADGDEPLAHIDRVDAEFDFWAALTGDLVVGDVTVDGLQVAAVRREDGTDNVRDLLERLRETGDAAGGTGGAAHSSLRPRSIRLTSGEITAVDRDTGVTLRATGLGAIAGQGGAATVTVDEVLADTGVGPSAALAQLVITLDLADPLGSALVDVGGGRVELWRGMTLTGIHGQIRQGDEPARLLVDLEGGYGGAAGTLWQAEGWLEPRDRAGRLELRADRFTLGRLDPVLRDSMVIDYADTSLDAAVALEVANGRASVVGEVDVSNLSIAHEKLALEPLRGLDGSARIDASFDLGLRKLVVSELLLTTRGVEYRIEGEAVLPRGRDALGAPRRDAPRFSVRLVVPPVDCQTVLASIPAAFVPKLQGFELSGTFETDLQIAIDWADFESTVLEGFVGIDGCKVEDEPRAFDPRLLVHTFEHDTLVGPEEYETVTIGMESIDFAPIWDTSSHLLKAIMTQEDSRFYDHDGFITREFRTALVKDLEAGFFKYGASSITMQMVKNVFLFRDKTLSRKLQELFLTWHVEQVLEKNRILEIYINAIEYGPGIYGIKPATATYFDKHPRDLTPVEAVYITTLLPAPRRRYFQYCRDKLTRWTKNKIGRMLRIMHERDRLTEEELADALEVLESDQPIEFNPVKRKDLCRKRPDW